MDRNLKVRVRLTTQMVEGYALISTNVLYPMNGRYRVVSRSKM